MVPPFAISGIVEPAAEVSDEEAEVTTPLVKPTFSNAMGEVTSQKSSSGCSNDGGRGNCSFGCVVVFAFSCLSWHHRRHRQRE